MNFVSQGLVQQKALAVRFLADQTPNSVQDGKGFSDAG